MKTRLKIFFAVLGISVITGALLTVIIEYSMYTDTSNRIEIAEREEAERLKILEDIAADKEAEKIKENSTSVKEEETEL